MERLDRIDIGLKWIGCGEPKVSRGLTKTDAVDGVWGKIGMGLWIGVDGGKKYLHLFKIKEIYMKLKPSLVFLFLVLNIFTKLNAQNLGLNELIQFSISDKDKIEDILFEKKYVFKSVKNEEFKNLKSKTYRWEFDGSIKHSVGILPTYWDNLRIVEIIYVEPFDNSPIEITVKYNVFNSNSYLLVKNQMIKSGYKLIQTFDTIEDGKTIIFSYYENDKSSISIWTYPDNNWLFEVEKKGIRHIREIK